QITTTETSSARAHQDLEDVELLRVLQALSDPVRLEIVRQLAASESPKGLACYQLNLAVSKPPASHHLKTLSQAGITTEREEGTRKYLALRRDELEARFPG